MYILLNFSRKIDCFNLYINCLNPLIKTNELAYIDLTSEIENINMDFVDIRQKVEASLSNASASIYNIIVLYDFEMQKKEPIVYSIAGMLNNIHDQIINPMKTNYAVEMIYFVALDDIGRGNNGEIVDVNLKKSLEFDINRYDEIVDALRTAYLHNHVIFAFDETAHNRDLVSGENIYKLDNWNELVKGIGLCVGNNDVVNEKLAVQKSCAADVAADEVTRALGIER